MKKKKNIHKKMLGLLSLLCVGLVLVYSMTKNSSDIEVMAGCEGEGCGCARKNVTDEAAVLYEKTDKNSTQIAALSVGTATKPPEAYMKILSKGKATVTSILNKERSFPVNVGDTIEMMMSEGEGFMSARFNGAWFDYYFEDLELETIEAPQYEQWYKITTENASGYSPAFPYEGCLE